MLRVMKSIPQVGLGLFLCVSPARDAGRVVSPRVTAIEREVPPGTSWAGFSGPLRWDEEADGRFSEPCFLALCADGYEVRSPGQALDAPTKSTARGSLQSLTLPGQGRRGWRSRGRHSRGAVSGIRHQLLLVRL